MVAQGDTTFPGVPLVESDDYWGRAPSTSAISSRIRDSFTVLFNHITKKPLASGTLSD